MTEKERWINEGINEGIKKAIEELEYCAECEKRRANEADKKYSATEDKIEKRNAAADIFEATNAQAGILKGIQHLKETFDIKETKTEKYQMKR